MICRFEKFIESLINQSYINFIYLPSKQQCHIHTTRNCLTYCSYLASLEADNALRRSRLEAEITASRVATESALRRSRIEAEIATENALRRSRVEA